MLGSSALGGKIKQHLRQGTQTSLLKEEGILREETRDKTGSLLACPAAVHMFYKMQPYRRQVDGGRLTARSSLLVDPLTPLEQASGHLTPLLYQHTRTVRILMLSFEQSAMLANVKVPGLWKWTEQCNVCKRHRNAHVSFTHKVYTIVLFQQ